MTILNRKTNFLKKLAAGVLSGALAVTMLSGTALASVSYDAPADLMDAESDILTGATAAANTVVLSVLGIDVASTNGAGIYNASGSTSNYGRDSANLGIYGTSLNDSPDAYLWNFFYNLSQSEGEEDVTLAEASGDYTYGVQSLWSATPYTLLWNSNKSGPTGRASGTTLISVDGYTAKTTNPAFYYEPDILLGGATDGYSSALADYQSAYNSSYDPTIFLGYGTSAGQYAANGTRSDGLGLEYNQFDMCTGVVYLGSVVQNLMNETGKVNRYDEGAYEIAVDYDKYDRGLYYYVQKLIAEGTMKEVYYASSLSYEDGYYVVSKDTSRMAQYASGIGQDIYDIIAADTTGSYIAGEKGYLLTEDQIIDLLNTNQYPKDGVSVGTGVVLGVDGDTDDMSALKDAGIRFMTNLPECVYGMTMQTVENGMGIPFYIGFFYYDQENSLNPANYIYYWIERFYHVSTASSMQTVIENMLFAEDENDVGASLPDGCEVDISSYSAAAVEAQIVQGIAYYRSIESELSSAEQWTTLDTSVGIGSSIRDTNKYYSCISSYLKTDSFGNVIYSFDYEEGTTALQAAYDASLELVESDYTAESWEVLVAAQEDAEKVLATENPEQKKINQALAALNAAVDALEANEDDADTIVHVIGTSLWAVN